MKIKAKKKRRVKELRAERDKLWDKFLNLPKKSSFSGLNISGKLERVQQELDRLEGDVKSKRYYPTVRIAF
ncbi:MAG: hypothetical protein Q8Q06_03585 [bacterium]|nr:hypothetical protein [bacterium]